MAAGTIASRISGLARDFTIAAAIGSGVIADLYSLGNTLPNIVYILVAGGALNAVFIPQLVRHINDDADGGNDFADRLISLTLLVLAAATVAAVLAAPWIVQIYATADYGTDQLSLATSFARYCLPQILFYGLYTMFAQVLNSRLRFGPPMFAPIVNNLVVIAAVLTFVWLSRSVNFNSGEITLTQTQVLVLGLGTTLGVVAQAIVLIPFLARAGYRWRPKWGFRGYGLGKTAKLAAWTIGLVLVNQIGFIVIARLSTQANVLPGAEGGLALYQRAYLMFMLPQSVITISIVTAIFPRMSMSAADGDHSAVGQHIHNGIRLLSTLIAPCALFLIAFGPAVGLVCFNWGRNTPEAAIYTGAVLAAFALGLLPFSLFYLFLRGWYAVEDTKTPFMVTVIYNLIAMPLMMLLFELASDRWKLIALAAAYALSYWMTLVITWYMLNRRLANLRTTSAVWHVTKAVVAATFAAGLALGAAKSVTYLRTGSGNITQDKATAFLAISIGGLVFVMIFLIISKIWKLPEALTLVRPVVAFLPRRLHPR